MSDLYLMEQIGAYGCPEPIHLAREPTSSHIEYLDLLPNRSSAALLPEAVAEFQGRPVMYLVDDEAAQEARNRDADAVQNLQQLLANRSEQACLGIVRPGQLDVYPINLDRKQLAKATPLIVQQSASDAPTFFQSLAAGAVPLEGQPKGADSVFHEIHHLLEKASAALVGRMKPLDVLSVTGRALFFRFLLDRHIILDSERGEICPDATELNDSFSNAEKAAATSCWLDETFNGDLLPLRLDLLPDAGVDDRRKAYVRLYCRLGTDTKQEVFLHLQAILRGWESLGHSFQRRLPIDWNDFNFAHIPIGVLSQVYETFSHQWDGKHAEKTSVYYTPKNIAQCLVEEAFGGLKTPADAHVLDPACGAGIFLVLAFRKLVRARWEKDGQRPDTRTIQRILYNQMCGFDVSESALRLAALALYITAIELNGSPHPPKSLKFPRGLQGHVLFNFGQHNGKQQKGFILGSLGTEVSEEFNGAFDLVIGNPPWTRLRATTGGDEDNTTEKARLDELNDKFTAITRRVLTARGLADAAKGYTNPDNNPDLPFIWRAAEWVKLGGLIAMALPGRILLKQSDQGIAARTALIRGLEITGIINGSNLSDTDVWPRMNQPFMLFFACNAVPPLEHRFYFATPVLESLLNDRGLFRLDYQAAEPVVASEVVEKPWLLKTLAVGTLLDADVMDRLTSPEGERLSAFWNGPGLYSGLGYNLSSNLKQRPADHLRPLLDFRMPETGFCIEYNSLHTWKQNYSRRTAHFPRSERLYEPPLLIVPQSPGEDRLQPKSFRSMKKALGFSQSYYGFSAAGHPDAEALVSLLYLITHSLLFQYYCLMVSSRIGAERRTFIKVDLMSFPFPNPEKFTSAKDRILDLADNLETQATKPWKQIDNFIFNLYGLDEDDATVVRDTLDVGAPYKRARGPAEQPAQLREAEIFRSYLEEMLQPSFAVVGQQINVSLIPAAKGKWEPSWRFLRIAINGDEVPVTDALICSLMEEANKAAASRVVMRVPEGGLLLGVLNQRRFWTRSRARLCGVYLLRHHLDAFPVERKK
ncbi:MAG: N-6 DNA methylase [Thermoguttaceae bacterium]